MRELRRDPDQRGWAAYGDAGQTAVAVAALTAATAPPSLDDTFDRRVRGIAGCEAAHPDHVLSDSPTGKAPEGSGRRRRAVPGERCS